MTTRKSSGWIRAAMAVGIAACLTCPTMAEDPVMMEEGAGDSDIGAVEEFALTPVSRAAPGEARPKPFFFNARGDYQFDSSIDTAGDFNVTRALAGVGMKFPLGERFGGAVMGVYDFAGYDFDDAAVFGGGEPWGDINSGRFMAVCNYTVNEQWSVFGGGIAAISAESGASASSAWTGGGFIGGGYRASDSLVVRLGVSVVSQLEDDAEVLPIFVFEWQIDERWQLRAGGLDAGASDAFGIGATYKLNEQWSLGARVAYHRNRFRLDDSGFAPDGVGQDQRVNGTLLATWRPRQHLEISVLGGVAFSGEIRVEDDDGNRLFKEDYDPAPFVGARLAWRF